MVGRIHYDPGGWGGVRQEERYGLPLLVGRVDPEGWFVQGRLRRAARGMSQRGVRRVLAPPEFDSWALLLPWQLTPLSPEPLVRFKAGEVALAALERMDRAPDRAAVALRAGRADRDMVRAACTLCPRVRNLIIDAPKGGVELASWLHREFGIPVLPPGERGAVALRFEQGGEEEEHTLHLYGQKPDLKGVSLWAPMLAEEERYDLPLLNLLWERGRLQGEALKIT